METVRMYSKSGCRRIETKADREDQDPLYEPHGLPQCRLSRPYHWRLLRLDVQIALGLQVGDDPIIIRIDTKSGHGASSTTKQLEQTADIYSFFFYNLGVTPKL